MRTKVLLGAALLFPALFWAADQPLDIRPGLWEMTTTVQMSGMPPIPNLDQMPPEQRAQIEAAMKGMGGPQITKTKTCITKEDIEKALVRGSGDKNGACEPKVVSATASKMVMHVDCTQGKSQVKSQGDMTIERQDPGHFKGGGAMKVTGNDGHTMNVKMSVSGAFLSSSCGNVKPD